METTISENIMPLVEEELQILSRRFPRHAEALRHAVEEFRILYGTRVFSNLLELANFCKEVDDIQVLQHLDPSLRHPIQQSRRAILGRLAQQDLQNNPPRLQDLDPGREIRGPRTVNGTKQAARSKEELQTLVEQYIDLAAQVGEEEVIQILISTNRISEQEIPRVIRTLKSYLGKSRAPSGRGEPNILGYDDEILHIQSVRRVVNRMLLRMGYNTLIGLGGDTMEHHERIRSRAGREIMLAMQDLAQKANISPRRHKDLFDERRTYFEQAAALHVPNCFVRTIEQEGELHPLPSWRQRIAIMEAQRQQHIIIGFEPGLGKTFIPIWLYQLLKERRLTEGRGTGRMLYIGPKIVMTELPNRIRPGAVGDTDGHSYYTSPELAPTVGVITDGLDDEQVAERMNAEIVFCPYSMLNIVKDGAAVSDRLLAHRQSTSGEPFTLLVADECHKIKGNGDWTNRMRQLIHQTSRLHSHGNVLLMSGTPATNTLADLRVIAELLEPEAANMVNNGQRQRRQRDVTDHPAFLRNMLERLIILDPPGDWQQHVSAFPYELQRNDQRLINAVVCDETRFAKNKIDTCLRIIRSTGNMIGYTCAQLEEYLNQRHTVLVAENIHAQGITREWNDEEGDDSRRTDVIFRDRLSEFLTEWSRNNNIPVNFHVIDGETNKTMRQKQSIFAQAAESDRNGDSKTVILAHSSCMNEGIDLRFIRRMIALEWPWTTPALQQLLQRSRRAGNRDIFLTAFFAQETLEQGIYEVAEDRYADVRSCLYAQGLSDRQLQRAARDLTDVSQSTRLLERLQSPEQRELFIQRILHGKGMKRYQNFWERDRNKKFFKEHHENAESSSVGDTERYIGSFIAALEDASVLNGGQYLHVHSRDLRLERKLHQIAPRPDRQVINMDPVEYMLEEGHGALRREGKLETPRIVKGSLNHLIRFVRHGQLARAAHDAVILEGLENTHLTTSQRRTAKPSERLRVLIGALRAVRMEGKIIITIPKGSCTRAEFQTLCEEVLPQLGCVVQNSWTGEGRSTDNEGDPAFRMYTAVATKVQVVDKKRLQRIQPSSMQLTHWSQWPEAREKSRFENERRRRKLPYGFMHTQFQLERHEFGSEQPNEHHERQLVHLHAIERAVAEIRNLAPTAKDFAATVPVDWNDLLAEIGVVYMPSLSPSKHRPAFQLVAYPDYFLYPYDSQWTSTEEE